MNSAAAEPGPGSRRAASTVAVATIESPVGALLIAATDEGLVRLAYEHDRRDELLLEATASIPFGEVLTYRELAAVAGNPRASRAAGTAMARNPVAIVIPCHRVLRSDGTIGNYGGGPEGSRQKEYLLRLEHAWPRGAGMTAALQTTATALNHHAEPSQRDGPALGSHHPRAVRRYPGF